MNDNINIRLVPTYLLGEMPVDPVHHTESGMFSICTYLVPVKGSGGVFNYGKSELGVTNELMFALYAHMFWMGHIVQKHLVIITDAESDNFDVFDLEEGLVHSQAVHDSFGSYMDGKSEMFPSFRAFGWAFVPFNEIMNIQMWEQRAVQQALGNGSYDFDNLIDWAMYLDILNIEQDEENQQLMLGDDSIGDITFVTDFGGKDQKITKLSGEPLDIPIDMGVNLNQSIQQFLDSLEKGLNDDETSGND